MHRGQDEKLRNLRWEVRCIRTVGAGGDACRTAAGTVALLSFNEGEHGSGAEARTRYLLRLKSGSVG